MSGCIYNYTRWILGGIFIYAGSTKLLEPKTFTVLVEAYGIIPESLLMPVALALPVLEVAAGVGLFFDIEGSLSVIAGLLGLFIAILGYGIWIGLDTDCGCFGPEDPEARAFHSLKKSLYRDLKMLAGVAFLCGWRQYRAIRPFKITLILKKLCKKGSTGWNTYSHVASCLYRCAFLFKPGNSNVWVYADEVTGWVRFFRSNPCCG